MKFDDRRLPQKTYSDGSKSEKYYKNGNLHRSDGPAFIMKIKNGSTLEGYYKEGILHREDGPALILTEIDGTVTENYFLNGECQDRNCADPALKWISSQNSAETPNTKSIDHRKRMLFQNFKSRIYKKTMD